MRKIMIAAAALGVAAPALAQDQQQIPRTSADDRVPEAQEYEPLDPRDAEIVAAIPNPNQVVVMGDIAARAAEAVLDVPIGPLKEAVEGRKLSRREREETLGDVASKGDPHYRERMRAQIGAMSVGVGEMVRQMAVLGPVLRQTVEDAQRRVEDAVNRPIQPATQDPEYRGEPERSD